MPLELRVSDMTWGLPETKIACWERNSERSLVQWSEKIPGNVKRVVSHDPSHKLKFWRQICQCNNLFNGLELGLPIGGELETASWLQPPSVRTSAPSLCSQLFSVLYRAGVNSLQVSTQIGSLDTAITLHLFAIIERLPAVSCLFAKPFASETVLRSEREGKTGKLYHCGPQSNSCCGLKDKSCFCEQERSTPPKHFWMKGQSDQTAWWSFAGGRSRYEG